MIELDIKHPTERLRNAIRKVWPEDMYTCVITEEDIHFYIKCDTCSFWSGSYTITLKYELAIIRVYIFKGTFAEVRSINKNKRRLY